MSDAIDNSSFRKAPETELSEIIASFQDAIRDYNERNSENPYHYCLLGSDNAREEGIEIVGDIMFATNVRPGWGYLFQYFVDGFQDTIRAFVAYVLKQELRD